MRGRALALALVLGAAAGLAAGGCRGDGVRYVGKGTASVTPRGSPADRRTSANPDEEARVRRLSDGRIEVELDDCTFTTEPAVGDRAVIAPGTACRAERVTASAQIVVQRGEVVLDEVAGTLSLRLEGEGRGSNLGSQVDVTYQYSFEGRGP